MAVWLDPNEYHIPIRDFIFAVLLTKLIQTFSHTREGFLVLQLRYPTILNHLLGDIACIINAAVMCAIEWEVVQSQGAVHPHWTFAVKVPVLML